MPTYTVALSGNRSTSKSSLFPELRLPKQNLYEVALLDLTTYNSIPNIVENDNNVLYFYKTDQERQAGSIQKATIKSGADEIDDINEYIQK